MDTKNQPFIRSMVRGVWSAVRSYGEIVLGMALVTLGLTFAVLKHGQQAYAGFLILLGLWDVIAGLRRKAEAGGRLSDFRGFLTVAVLGGIMRQLFQDAFVVLLVVPCAIWLITRWTSRREPVASPGGASPRCPSCSAQNSGNTLRCRYCQTWLVNTARCDLCGGVFYTRIERCSSCGAGLETAHPVPLEPSLHMRRRETRRAWQ